MIVDEKETVNMDSDTIRNLATWEVVNNLGPSTLPDASAVIREKYQVERDYQTKLKEESK